MAYSDFTFTMLQKQLDLVIEEIHDLFAHVPEGTVSEFLHITLEENVPLALSIQTEKARSSSGKVRSGSFFRLLMRPPLRFRRRTHFTT